MFIGLFIGPKRGAGVAIYVKKKFQVSLLLSKSVAKQFLALEVEVSKSLFLTIIDCYRTPSADGHALSFSEYNAKELIALGDFNWNWLHPVSDGFRAHCDSLKLFQLVDSRTRQNSKNPEKSSLIDVILTSMLCSSDIV